MNGSAKRRERKLMTKTGNRMSPRETAANQGKVREEDKWKESLVGRGCGF